MRIPTLLQKIAELSEHPERRTAIDVDLLLDYTRVLYADLLEWRSKLPATLRSPEMAVTQAQTLADSGTAAVPKPSERHANEDKKGNEETSKQPARETDHSATKADTKDIRALIGINDKYQIMSELFGNDKAAYEDALSHINNTASADTAIEWLRDRLWIAEEHSDAVQLFFGIIRNSRNQ